MNVGSAKEGIERRVIGEENAEEGVSVIVNPYQIYGGVEIPWHVVGGGAVVHVSVDAGVGSSGLGSSGLGCSGLGCSGLGCSGFGCSGVGYLPLVVLSCSSFSFVGANLLLLHFFGFGLILPIEQLVWPSLAGNNVIS